jgi:UDP-N-acetylmuramoylalanine--D-glutamate ligase
MTSVAGRRVTVLGLGHFGGGTAVTRWLVENGATVTVVDVKSPEELAEPLAALAGLPVTFHLGPNPPLADFASADLVVASPAVPPTNPQVSAARSAGVEITTEIRLFTERCRSKIFGVTGTKGQSPTTELLGRMLKTRGTTWVGGNIGRSLLADLPNIRPGDFVVLELSSFMLWHLAAARWSPHVAVVTMISQDHLDWHGTVADYIGAKRTITAFQTADDFAVLSAADAATFGPIAGKLRTYPPADATPFHLKLAGDHNQRNAQAAFVAATIAGVTRADAGAAVAGFQGLPHRLQVVAERGGVTFVNDSIATNPDAAMAALRSYPAGTVIQIVGGSGKKHLPFADFAAALAARAKLVLCIGETGPEVAAAVETAGGAKIAVCGDLANAVESATSAAVPGDVVLLSPGFPSYDQFVNYQGRGDEFTSRVSSQQPKTNN